eukprot:Transcript_5426.p1 GENE.Transcript_5426~~Transcript_5426.p1  ORF type:complete len:449 (-),score=91.39 Transcript_5426:187-1533(-)
MDACPAIHSSHSPTQAPKHQPYESRSPQTTTKQKQPRIARQNHLTETEKMQLAIRWALLPQRTDGTKIGVKALEIRCMVAPGYVANHLDIPKLLGARPEAKPLQRKVRSDAGVPRVLTPEHQAVFAKQAGEWNWNFTFGEMEEAMKEAGVDVSDTTLWRHCVSEGWNTTARTRTVPLLRETHREARVEFAQETKDEDWGAWCDLDEKWFYSVGMHRTHKIPPGMLAPLTPVQHKSHIPKVMHVAAIARPRFKTDARGKEKCTFTGKIGCWRVSEPKEALRDSKNHRKGDIYEVDVTMNSDRYVELMTTKILPAIADAFRPFGVPCVTVQHDGAPPHVGKGAEGRIDEFGATLEPPIKIKRQPSQSPDTNILDLSFFRALAASVHKLRRGDDIRKVQFDLQKLSDDVVAAYDAYPPTTIEKMWSYKSVVMQKIIEAEGGNFYDRRRPKE